jgi:hypothetical protein
VETCKDEKEKTIKSRLVFIENEEVHRELYVFAVIIIAFVAYLS